MRIPTATLELIDEDIMAGLASYRLTLEDADAAEWKLGQLPAVRMHAFTEGPFADPVSAVVRVEPEDFLGTGTFEGTLIEGFIAGAQHYVIVTPNGRRLVPVTSSPASGSDKEVGDTVTITADEDEWDTDVAQEFRFFMMRRVPCNLPIRAGDLGPGLDFYYGSVTHYVAEGKTVVIDGINTDINDPNQCLRFAGVISGALGTDFADADRLQLYVATQGEGTIALYGTANVIGTQQQSMRPCRETFLTDNTTLYAPADDGSRGVNGSDYVWSVSPCVPLQRTGEHPRMYGYVETPP